MYDQFDVVVKRLSKKLGDSWIQVFSPEEKSKISQVGLDPNKVSMEYLTDEEDAYEKYVLEDVPFVSRPTSVSYVNRVLSKLIQQADIDFGTNLKEEFVEWAEKEKKEWESRKAEAKESESAKDEEVTEETTSTEIPSFDSMETVETEESSDDELPSEVEEPTVTKTKKVVKSAFNIVALYDKHPHLKELTDEEKSLIVGYEDNKFKYKEGIDIAQCPTCLERLLKEGYSEEEIDKQSLADIADDFKTCPYCGQKF